MSKQSLHIPFEPENTIQFKPEGMIDGFIPEQRRERNAEAPKGSKQI